MRNRKKSPGSRVEPQPQSWLDLTLYLVCGVGLFFLTTYLFTYATSLLAHEWTALHSFTISLLSAGCLGGTVYVLGVRRGKITWSGIGFKPVRWQWQWLLAMILVLIFTVPIQILVANSIDDKFTQDSPERDFQRQSRMELVTGSDYSFSWTKFGLTLLSFGLIGPIVEELYFRGLIHTWFQSRFGYGVRVLASSLIFGLSHLPQIGNAFSAFVSGLILVVAYEKSRSIWLSIATHVANNSFLVVVVYWGLAMMARYQ